MLDNGTLYRLSSIHRGLTIKKYFTLPIIVLSFFMSFCAADRAMAAEKAVKSVLDNGAAVVCTYMPGSQLVTIEIGVLSGLSNEGQYAGSGMSHLLEHLLFKGTSSMSGQEINREIKALGGLVNGSTGLDSAEYHITVPVKNFEKALGLIVEMVMDPAFSNDELLKEKNIVLKEIKLHEDDPSSRQMELLFAEAYREGIYKHPIIGYKDRLEALTREDILTYHAAAYTPDRVVVGIAGGVPAGEAIEAARKKLSGYKRAKVLFSASLPREPRQFEARLGRFPAEVNLGYLAIAYHTTDLYSRKLYAGDVLSNLLGEGKDSRLYKRLVTEKQLLYAVTSVNYTPRYPGLFVITGIGDPDKLDAARSEIFSVIDEMKYGKIDNVEMEKAKNSALSEYYSANESTSDVASAITTSQMMTGEPDFPELYVEGIKQVQISDVKSMLSGYLKDSNSTTVELLPSCMLESRDTAIGAALTEEPEESIKLANGLSVFVKARSRVPLVSVTLVVPGGVRSETPEKNGVAGLTASMLLKGTRKLGERDIVPALERKGANLEAFSGMNGGGLFMSMLSKDYPVCMDVFEACLKEPVFKQDEIPKLKAQVLASIKERDNDIFENGMDELRKVIFKDHPYAMSPLGSAESVENITRQDLVDFHSKYFVPGGSVLVVIGDVDVDKVMADITRRFGTWQGKPAEIPQEAIKPLSGRESKDIYMDKRQSLVLLGYDGIKAGDPREYPLSFINSLLSGADGLLFESFREDEGLAYASGALSVQGYDPGYFSIFVATTEENIQKVTDTAIGLVAKIASGDITEQEIAACRNKILSQHAASIESNQSLGMTVALDGLYGLGFGHYKDLPGKINSVTKEDIVAFAQDLLGKGNYALVTVRPEKK